MKQQGTFTSDIYRSLASDDFCFTVATPIRGKDGGLRGVLAADIQFGALLSS
jgi:hypothetical protein